MAAPKNNQFWKARSKHGRDKIFETPEILWDAAKEYFEWVDANPIEAQDNKGTKHVNTVKFNRPYTEDALCIFLDIGNSTLHDYKKREDFSDVIRKIEAVIRNQKFEGAAVGIFKENIIARDLGLKDRKDFSSEDGSMSPPRTLKDIYKEDAVSKSES